MTGWTRGTIGQAALLVAVVAAPCAAQTVNSAMVWGAVFGDHRIADKTALYWDLQARRADAGATWQLALGAVGLTRDLSKQWRVTGALGWSRGYRYGAFPARSNSFELRPWLQVSGTHRAGTFAWTDRSRLELRMLHPIGEFAPPNAGWAPTIVRLRRLDRLQHRLTTDDRWYYAVAQELFVNVAPAPARVAALEQTRWQLLAGRRLSKHTRAEAGYGLQRINRTGGYEMNHTLLLYLRTSAPIR